MPRIFDNIGQQSLPMLRAARSEPITAIVAV